MTFDELLQAGMKLKASEADELMHLLMQHPGAPALVAMVRQMHDTHAQEIADRNLITVPNAQTHIAGSMRALQRLEEEFKRCLPSKKRPKSKPDIHVI